MYIFRFPAASALFIPPVVCIMLAIYYWVRSYHLDESCSQMANSDCGADGAALAAIAWTLVTLLALVFCACIYIGMVRKRSGIKHL